MEETNAITNRQKYVNFCVLAQKLIAEINLDPKLKDNQTVKQIQAQLERCLSLPITNESLNFFAKQIDKLQSYRNQKSEILNPIEPVGEEKESGYVMVKKSGRAYIPIEAEAQEIEKPNYDVPIAPSRRSLREMPDFIVKDKPIRIPVTNSNRGSSHIWMLAFLTFFFESLFLLISFFLYR